MAKYIFVTGGVVSGLGKGITAASLGRLLKARGFKVAAQKLDPYINVDPGTMSPLQHGEVFVTEDGAETDLDLGHYERFIDEDLNRFSNLTTGRVYQNVIEKERRGEYLGKTIQVIPHITDEIKGFIYGLQKKTGADIVITEIGGTVGDIESQPFLEAIRQVGQEVGMENRLYIHVTLIPWLEASKEHKSKPTQHSVRELRSYGISPDMIVLRSDRPVEQEVLDKTALFCNVERDCVIENITLPSIYEAPLRLEAEGLARAALRKLSLDADLEPELSDWEELSEHIRHPKESLNIALVGKYTSLQDAYLSVNEALKHGGWKNECEIKLNFVDSDAIMVENVSQMLSGADGIVVPGGFGVRGTEGMMIAASFAREQGIPYLGLCLGMQIAVIAFARDVLGYKDANSSELCPNTPHPVIDLMPEQKGIDKKGGTMRLGAWPCVLRKGSRLYDIYINDCGPDLSKEAKPQGSKTEPSMGEGVLKQRFDLPKEGDATIYERHRHRYEFNPDYADSFEAAGMELSGKSPDGKLAEAVELKDHPFYIGVQYHPEFKSRPTRPHPLFTAFTRAALEYKHTKDD